MYGLSLSLSVMSLTCYTCVFPAISPLDCVMVPQDCSSGQQCLYSTATATKGSLSVALHEKSCAVPSQCGLSGVKHAAGFNFSYTNKCCNIDLCNAAELSFPCCMILKRFVRFYSERFIVS
uniref:UPAR/Ly6 domain-containing protein n=1 Tax=Electrophorus electricus TaxID=8005 RepID=A0A4W4GG96_ELEEL